MREIFLAMAVVLLAAACTEISVQEEKPRVIVTCDPELDDNNSLIRYLLFSTDFDTEGLIYASSQFHWKGDGKGGTQYIPGREYARPGRDLGPQTHWRWAEGERFIDTDVEAYAEVYPNLIKHNPDYPAPEYLKSIIREGNVEFEGDISHDTPGSDLIKQVLLDDDPRPVFIQVWGGPSTGARALKSIEEEYSGTPEWDAVKEKVSAKALFCLSGQQDTTFRGYVRVHWPDVKAVAANSGIAPLGYGAKRSVHNQEDTVYFAPEWTLENIKSKGILGDLYRVWGDGKQMAPGDFTDYFGQKGHSMQELADMGYWVWTPPMPEGNFISEGDTPQYMNLIGNGLRAWQDETWGGWGGRRLDASARATEADMMASYGRPRKDDVLPDFIPAIQNNFAARMAWSVTPDFAGANHEPRISGPEEMHAKAGEAIKLKVKATDPDGDALSCSWAQYKVGSYKGDVCVSDPSKAAASVTIPSDAVSGETIHLVLTVIDDGKPRMTSYKRIVITVD